MHSRNEEILRRAISDHGVKVIDMATLIAVGEKRINSAPSPHPVQFTAKPTTTALLIRDMVVIPASGIFPVVIPFALKACLAASGDYNSNHSAYDIKASMTNGEIVLGVVYAVSTVAVSSFIVFHSSLPSLRTFESTLKAYCAAPLSQTVYMLTSISASFSLAEVPFQFAKVLSSDNVFPAIFSMLSLPTFFVAINVATNKIHSRILNAYTIDSDEKYLFADLLARINPKYKFRVEKLFNEVKLGADSLDERAEQFASRLSALVKDHSDLFVTMARRELITKKSIVVFNVASVMAFAISAFIIMTQRGFNSANTAASLFNNQNVRDDLFWLKLIQGLLTSLGTTLIFANSGIEARHQALDLLSHLKTHRRQIPRALLLVASAGLASAAMYRFARESLEDDNLFEIPNDSAVANTMTVLFTLSTLLIFFSLILKVPARAFANFFAPLHPTENETTVAFLTKQLRDGGQIISRSTATAIRELHKTLPDTSQEDDIEAQNDNTDPDHDNDAIAMRPLKK